MKLSSVAGIRSAMGPRSTAYRGGTLQAISAEHVRRSGREAYLDLRAAQHVVGMLRFDRVEVSAAGREVTGPRHASRPHLVCHLLQIDVRMLLQHGARVVGHEDVRKVAVRKCDLDGGRCRVGLSVGVNG